MTRSQTIVEGLLWQHDKTERNEIIFGLKKFQRQHEIRGVRGPSFRPAFVSLLEEDWHYNLLDCHRQAGLNPKLPAFLSMPELNMGYLGDIQGNKQSSTAAHCVKSLLEYHYRYNTDLAGEFARASVESSFVSPITATIRELWCLAIDNSKSEFRIKIYGSLNSCQKIL